MSTKEALLYFNQGMKMLHTEQLEKAVDFFTKAIELNPDYTEAYQNRGEIYTRIGKVIEGNTDIQKAKTLRTGKKKGGSGGPKVQKMDMNAVENIYDDVFAAGGGDAIEFDTGIYDYVFSDDSLESDDLWDSLADEDPGREGFPAILEYINGDREEVPGVLLFQPSEDEITIVQDGGNSTRVVPLENLACVRTAGVPQEFDKHKTPDCHVEIVETIDGNIYHESIHPDQDLRSVLFGFSTKDNTRFRYSLIPRQNIRKRYQRRFLGEILLEKRFIAGDVLKHALEEHKQLKNMKFGRIIAQQARILYSAVEVEIQKAYEANKKGLKIGEILLDGGLVTEEQVLDALAYQERLQSLKIGQFLIGKGILQEREVYMALAEKFRIPFLDLRKQKVPRKILTIFPRELVTKLKVLPLGLREGALVVATVLPDPSAICEIVMKHSPLKDVDFVLVQPTHLKNVLRVLYQKG